MSLPRTAIANSTVEIGVRDGLRRIPVQLLRLQLMLLLLFV